MHVQLGLVGLSILLLNWLTNQLFSLKHLPTTHLVQLLGRHGSQSWLEMAQGGELATGLLQEHDNP